MIRAKFRCLSIHQELLQGTTIRLLPVNPKGPDGQGSEENRRFWSATPSGELYVRYRSEEAPLTLGGYYYLDMTEAPKSETTWSLWELTQQEESLGVKMSLRWTHTSREPVSADLTMDIRNTDAWGDFQGKVGTHWNVLIYPEK